MLLTLKSEYALRAVALLASHAPDFVKTDTLAREERLPREFIVIILGRLRRHGLLRTRRGSGGGYALTVPAESLTLGEVVRIVDGPLAVLPALQPEQVGTRAGDRLARVWVAVSANIEAVLDHTTIADLIAGRIPDEAARAASRHAAVGCLGSAVPLPEPTPGLDVEAGAR